MTFKLPHTAGSITVAAGSWTIADGSLLYFTWDQVALGSATATVSTTVPLPDAYPLTTKYFVAVMRVGSLFYLWDGSRIPMNGGRWPVPSPSRDVVPTAAATSYLSHYFFIITAGTATIGATYSNNGFIFTVLSSIAGQTSLFCSGTGLPALSGILVKVTGTGDTNITFSAYTNSYSVVNNTAWLTVNGTKHFLWENLAVMTSTGIALNRNTLVSQSTPSVGLTNLADGEGLMITHTWNPGAAQNATIAKVTLPLTTILEQNQFLWVQNRSGYLLFTGEN